MGPPNPYGVGPGGGVGPNPYGVGPYGAGPYGAGPPPMQGPGPSPYGGPMPNYPMIRAGANPYAAPVAAGPWALATVDEPLADRGTRLAARFVDGGLYLGSLGVGAAGFAVGPMFGVGFVIMALLALVVYQWVLISSEGQSLGKKWLGIRIIKTDGSLPGFVHGVLLRSWVMQVAAGVIPFVGLIDALLIFSDDRRCLHDHIAGTRVVIAGD